MGGLKRLQAQENANLMCSLQDVFDKVDTDRNGVIDYTEFLAGTVDKRVALQNDKCWSAFNAFDRDNSGKISREEISQVLGTENVQHAFGYSAEQIQKLMEEFDKDGDGEIDFNEFMT